MLGLINKVNKMTQKVEVNIALNKARIS